MSNVKLREEGNEDTDGSIAVSAYFKPLDVVRVDFFPEDDTEHEGKSYMVIRNIGEPEDNENFRFIKEATNAKSVNLWYQLGNEGFHMIQDVEMVRDLEQSLEFYEQDRRAAMH